MEAERQAQELEAHRKQQEEDERMEWGKGMAQKRKAEEMVDRLQRETEAPLAVYADDREYNHQLKQVDRWGDPMAQLTQKKSSSKKLVYKGPPGPPNRFGILPGYRWDGVDRSTGFEAMYFKHKNSKMFQSQEAYQWSAADM